MSVSIHSAQLFAKDYPKMTSEMLIEANKMFAARFSARLNNDPNLADLYCETMVHCADVNPDLPINAELKTFSSASGNEKERIVNRLISYDYLVDTAIGNPRNLVGLLSYFHTEKNNSLIPGESYKAADKSTVYVRDNLRKIFGTFTEYAALAPPLVFVDNAYFGNITSEPQVSKKTSRRASCCFPKFSTQGRFKVEEIDPEYAPEDTIGDVAKSNDMYVNYVFRPLTLNNIRYKVSAYAEVGKATNVPLKKFSLMVNNYPNEDRYAIGLKALKITSMFISLGSIVYTEFAAVELVDKTKVVPFTPDLQMPSKTIILAGKKRGNTHCSIYVDPREGARSTDTNREDWQKVSDALKDSDFTIGGPSGSISWFFNVRCEPFVGLDGKASPPIPIMQDNEMLHQYKDRLQALRAENPDIPFNSVQRLLATEIFEAMSAVERESYGENTDEQIIGKIFKQLFDKPEVRLNPDDTVYTKDNINEKIPNGVMAYVVLAPELTVSQMGTCITWNVRGCNIKRRQEFERVASADDNVYSF